MGSDADQYAPLDSKHQANASTSSRKVAYYYDQDVGNYTYGLGHPMKPHRMRMTHNLVLNYDLMSQMEIFRPIRATPSQMTKFHSDDYVDFLQSVTPETVQELTNNGTRCLVGEDCPAFEGLFEFCSISAGGSIGAAERLNSGQADIAINWAGGLHHAKKTEASGFCYVNDINLGILELLRIHPRVLYIDVDVHHGDGVEEAFYSTDRVMTCSFHRFGDFFPGTGDVKDSGIGRGKGYAVNVPLRDGITDESFQSIFKPVIQHIMDFYRPGAVVLQCGADSLAGDKLGCFNLSLEGHAECARFVRTFNLPTMMLGGGGYTTKNVARAWTYETAVMCGVQLDENLPYNQYLEYYGPKYKLEVLQNNMDNHNTPEYLENIKVQVLENLRNLPHAPGVQIRNVPSKSIGNAIGITRFGNEDEPETAADIRLGNVLRERIAARYDQPASDDEGANGMEVDSDEEIFASGRTSGRGRRPGGADDGDSHSKRSGFGAEKVTGAARRAAKAKAAAAAQRAPAGYVPPVVISEPSTTGSYSESAEGTRKKRSFFASKAPFSLLPIAAEATSNGNSNGNGAPVIEDWTISGARSRAVSPMSVV